MSFATFLASDQPRTLLAEMDFAYESGGAPATGTLYFCRNEHPQRIPFITGSGDTPANIAYRDAIRVSPSLTLSAPMDPATALTRVELGSLVLDNPDGALDFMLDLVVDGQQLRVLIGAPEWNRSDFELVLVAVVERVEAATDDTITVILRDQRRLLNKDIAGDVVNDERRKPIVISAAGGPACSIEPVEKNASTLQYWCLQNFAGASLIQVYDNGVPLRDTEAIFLTGTTADAGTDTLTKTGHGYNINDVLVFSDVGGSSSLFTGLSFGVQYWIIAAGFTANDYRLSLTKGGAAVNITGTSTSGTILVTRHLAYDNIATDGSIQLSATPAGRVVVDLLGRSASQSSTSVGVGPVLEALLMDYGGIDAGDIDSASFTAASAGLSGNVQQAGRAILDRENLLTVLDDIARCAQVFYGPGHEGTFHAGRMDLSELSSETPTRTLGFAGCLTAPAVRNGSVVTGTVAARSRRNYRPLSYGELAVSVDVDDKRAFAAAFREMRESTAPSGTSYANNWQQYHKTATRIELSGAFSADAANITLLADEILGDMKPHVRTVEVTTDLTAFDWRLGEVVEFTYPRYGFDAGVNCRIARISADFDAEQVTLTLITRVDAEVTTGSYP